jgi:hypothetical protein
MRSGQRPGSRFDDCAQVRILGRRPAVRDDLAARAGMRGQDPVVDQQIDLGPRCERQLAAVRASIAGEVADRRPLGCTETFRLGMGETADQSKAQPLPAGSFFALRPGMAHHVFIDEDTVIQISTNGPWDLN